MKKTRRNWMQAMLAGGVSLPWVSSPLGGLQPLSAWSSALGQELVAQNSQQHFILLWMAGGPSQIDTFDLKVGNPNGGPFRELPSNVPGIRFSEHLPGLSQHADKLAIVRSLKTKEGDHGRATYLVRTGQRPGSPVKYPSFPAALAQRLSPRNPLIPDYVSVLPATFLNPAAFGSGFLGPRHQPLIVASQNAVGSVTDNGAPAKLRVENLEPSLAIGVERLSRRRELWEMLQQSYQIPDRGPAPQTHDTIFRRAMKLSDSELNVAFDIEAEPPEMQAAYGNGQFGQGCLMARRLIERGVPVVEVTLGSQAAGWDTHLDNFKQVEALSRQLDMAWTQLLVDLDQRGLLPSTTILWIGEFGRTPTINPQGGRDHFPDAFCCVMAGGRIAGGQAYGRTSIDGATIEEEETSVQAILATAAISTGISPDEENISDQGRPIRIVEAEPIERLLT